MHDVGVGQGKQLGDEVGGLNVTIKQGRAHVGGVAADQVEEFVGLTAADVWPSFAVGEVVGVPLAPGVEKVLAFGGEGGVEGGEGHGYDAGTARGVARKVIVVGGDQMFTRGAEKLQALVASAVCDVVIGIAGKLTHKVAHDHAEAVADA